MVLERKAFHRNKTTEVSVPPRFSVRIPDSDLESQKNADPDPSVTRLLAVSADITFLLCYK
jgi:hypothetical protein